MRTVVATRYVTPLREGGSVPGIVEADDEGLYVVKFRGAAQGPKALVAELIAGLLGRAAGLRVPEIVYVEFDGALARMEPDQEIRDTLKASAGLNAGLDFLPGAITFDPIVGPPPGGALASDLALFDALTMNVDRTPRNPNLLVWHGALHPIDHGAALYFHHAWPSVEAAVASRFPAIRDHVLLPWADDLHGALARLRAALPPEVVAEAVAAVPDAWLDGDADAQRAAYAAVLNGRLASPEAFLEEAARARALLV
jgi:hypothetical protein